MYKYISSFPTVLPGGSVLVFWSMCSAARLSLALTSYSYAILGKSLNLSGPVNLSEKWR